MSKFEWVELETLSAEVARLQSRIDAARLTKNYGLVQLLEITKGLSNAVPAGQRPIEVPVQEVHPNSQRKNKNLLSRSRPRSQISSLQQTQG